MKTTTDCTTHANILDLDDLRARMETLEESLANILNGGDLEALQEFTGGMDLTDADLAQFDLSQYVSPDFEESEAEELLALREVFQDIGTCAGNALIADDHFPDFAEEQAYDLGDLQRDSFLSSFIDWDRVADYMQADYNKVIVGSVDYWVLS